MSICMSDRDVANKLPADVIKAIYKTGSMMTGNPSGWYLHHNGTLHGDRRPVTARWWGKRLPWASKPQNANGTPATPDNGAHVPQKGDTRLYPHPTFTAANKQASELLGYDTEWKRPKGDAFGNLWVPAATDTVDGMQWHPHIGHPDENDVTGPGGVFGGNYVIEKPRYGQRDDTRKQAAAIVTANANEALKMSRTVRSEHQAANEHLRSDIAQLRPLLEEIGIRPGTLTVGELAGVDDGELSGGLGVMLPPEAFKELVEMAMFMARS